MKVIKTLALIGSIGSIRRCCIWI